ncbi:MAG: outer membrane beta-barrel protein [Limnohabitans sp.]|nr:outer membrane beta-barrel protein [Limnohabitans sp.]
MKLFYKVISVVLISYSVFAQDSIKVDKPTVDLSGFVDVYYNYDFSDADNFKTKNFIYNYARHNEFNVNIGLIKASISYQNVYAKLALQAGTYVKDNYGNLNLFNEAYLGVYVDRSRKTSIEAGIMPSYIGFETASSHSNLTATRSLIAENSPYYMTGVKFNHQLSDKIYLSAMFSNGWQRIEKVSKKSLPSFGTQLQYKKSDTETFNWSTFIGDEPVEDFFRTRFFNNLYWDKQWGEKWRTILGFDIGAQKKAEGTDYSSWWGAAFISKYAITKKWETAIRTEYYNDVDNVIVDPTGIIPREFTPFKTFGSSVNLDFLPNSKMKIRTEAKWFNATEPIFKEKRDSFMVVTTMSFEF